MPRAKADATLSLKTWELEAGDIVRYQGHPYRVALASLPTETVDVQKDKRRLGMRRQSRWGSSLIVSQDKTEDAPSDIDDTFPANMTWTVTHRYPDTPVANL